jgi:hypothetical protein
MRSLLIRNVDAPTKDKIRSVMVRIHSGTTKPISNDVITSSPSAIVQLVSTRVLHLHPRVLVYLVKLATTTGGFVTDVDLLTLSGVTDHTKHHADTAKLITVLEKFNIDRAQSPPASILTYSGLFDVENNILCTRTDIERAPLVVARASVVETVERDFKRFDVEYKRFDNSVVVVTNTKRTTVPSTFVVARGTKNVVRKNQWTTSAVKTAVDTYQAVVQGMIDEDVQNLKIACTQLSKTDVLFKSLTAVVYRRMLYQHQCHVLPRGWSNGGDTTTPTSTLIDTSGMFPYWLSRKTATCSNVSVTHGTTTVVTAPNASGKSTLLRTLIVGSLLYNTGLYVPANTFQTSTHLSSYHIRMPCNDRPSKRLSSFELEMKDMSDILDGCDSNSLVVLDEIGRGTSPREGVALGTALIKYMIDRKITTVFATHLFDLLDVNDKVCTLTCGDDHSVTVGSRRTSHAHRVMVRQGLPTVITDHMQQLLGHTKPDESDPKSKFESVLAIATAIIGTPPTIHDDRVLPPSVLTLDAAMYVIEEDDGRVYVGESSNVVRRVQQHHTRGRSLVKIAVYTTTNKTLALQHEAMVQRAVLEQLPTNTLSSSTDSNHSV